jgi:hypothetical protein
MSGDVDGEANVDGSVTGPQPLSGNRNGLVFVRACQCSLTISCSIWRIRSVIAVGGGSLGAWTLPSAMKLDRISVNPSGE